MDLLREWPAQIIRYRSNKDEIVYIPVWYSIATFLCTANDRPVWEKCLVMVQKLEARLYSNNAKLCGGGCWRMDSSSWVSLNQMMKLSWWLMVVGIMEHCQPTAHCISSRQNIGSLVFRPFVHSPLSLAVSKNRGYVTWSVTTVETQTSVCSSIVMLPL